MKLYKPFTDSLTTCSVNPPGLALSSSNDDSRGADDDAMQETIAKKRRKYFIFFSDLNSTNIKKNRIFQIF